MEHVVKRGALITEAVENANEKEQKKKLKKTVGYMAWGLVFYTMIEAGLAIVGMIFYLLVNNFRILMNTPNWLHLTSEEVDALFSMDVSDAYMGALSCVVVVVGVGFLFLYFEGSKFGKTIEWKQRFLSHKKMKSGTFFQILCVFLGVQLVTEPIFRGLEMLFNGFGYSVLSSMEDATSASASIPMFLYAVILGPVIEELIYRGFVLSSLEKLGKGCAIAVSALLFGLMHTNIPQSMFAFLLGTILGYVAIEYSIWWAILLHVINNGAADFLCFLTNNLSESSQNVVLYSIFGVFFLLGMFFLWKKRVELKRYWTENKPQKKYLLYVFTTAGMLVFIVMETISAFTMVEKLG